MLTALDHIVLICTDIDIGVSTYSALLGRQPDWRSESPDTGTANALFRLENTALEIVAPHDSPVIAGRFAELLGGKEGRLTSLAFATDDIQDTRRILERRGLMPGDIARGQSRDISSKKSRNWSRFRCDDNACAGIKTFILSGEASVPFRSVPGGDVSSLDHVVITTPNPDRTIAHYGTRLGLRFALDRTIEAFKTRFLFFRIGGLTLEIIHRIDQDHDIGAHDAFWGLTWEVKNLAAAHARLSDAGLEISDIRTGRKPGSQVFTVRNRSLDIPTLFIAHEERDS